VIPNASFSDQPVRNYSANGIRRNDIVVGIAERSHGRPDRILARGRP